MLTDFVRGLVPDLIALLGAVVAILGGLFFARKSGRDSARAETAENNLEAVQRRDRRRTDIEKESDDALVGRIVGDDAD